MTWCSRYSSVATVFKQLIVNVQPKAENYQLSTFRIIITNCIVPGALLQSGIVRLALTDEMSSVDKPNNRATESVQYVCIDILYVWQDIEVIVPKLV